jgi:hypothetical protein
MAHLKKLPTYFVKDGVRREAYFTVQARELLEQGFVEEGAEKAEPAERNTPLPEVPVVAGGDGFEFELIEEEEAEEAVEEEAEEKKPAPRRGRRKKNED